MIAICGKCLLLKWGLRSSLFLPRYIFTYKGDKRKVIGINLRFPFSKLGRLNVNHTVMLIMSVQMQSLFVIIQNPPLALGSWVALPNLKNNSWGWGIGPQWGCVLTSCLYHPWVWWWILCACALTRDMYTSIQLIQYIHVYIYIYIAWHYPSSVGRINLDVFHIQFQGSHTSQCSHRPLLPATWRREGDSGLTRLKLGKPKKNIFNKTETMILGREVSILYLLWMAEILPQVDGWIWVWDAMVSSSWECSVLCSQDRKR